MRFYLPHQQGGDHYKERVVAKISKSHPGGPVITSLTGERAKLQEDPQGSAERQRQAESEPPKQNEARKSSLLRRMGGDHYKERVAAVSEVTPRWSGNHEFDRGTKRNFKKILKDRR
ncbi:hypothetical protein RND71_009446 [Anisodus tanguticus]|uniref:Uncharacterized protein n=1 Tax=Anisodus tanguticus TaxID=243964 RepID=A0AAE1VMX5_9SOLA|nr:hypothetical protein RND71_009446 [Anisodus tanguticus]